MILSFDARPAGRIATIIHNLPLALAIEKSVASALGCPFAQLAGGNNEWDIFKSSLDTAIRDIENHPRGILFRRLLEYGPQYSDSPEASQGDGDTILSDTECGSCVEFIFSHMINRFKGELAELLALAPCIGLMEQYKKSGRLPHTVHLYWGELVRERRRTKRRIGKGNFQWGGFTKGADGLFASEIANSRKPSHDSLCIYGIVEVKSMVRSPRMILDQIGRHISRLKGGVKLGMQEWPRESLILNSNSIRRSGSGLVRAMVMPSNWKLSREWQSVRNQKGRVIMLPEPSDPPVTTQIKELAPSILNITLAWSQEALEQAAYEMTFWYMSQVGRHVYTGKPMPRGWEDISPEEAGYNATKMILYHIILRCVSKRQEFLATRLYNVYSFGYPLGADSKEMLWPKDFPHAG